MVRIVRQLVLLIAATYAPSGFGQSKPVLRWLDSQQDREMWTKVQRAFQTELLPDKPDLQQDTYGYKYLRRIGVFDNSALVIVGNRIKRAETDGEYFTAFNYNPVSGARSRIIDPFDQKPLGMYRWKFIRFARFESSAAPDVVFSYLTCWECEPGELLTSLLYDSAAHQWRVRRWGNAKVRWWMGTGGLVMWTDILVGADEMVAFDCLYGFPDLDKDGYDDLAIRCREVNEPTPKKFVVADTTVVYSLKSGRFEGEIVTNKEERNRVWKELCKDASRNKLCGSTLGPK